MGLNIDWKVILANALLMLIAKFGEQALDIIGSMLLAILRSLSPEQKVALLKKNGLTDDDLKDVII